MSPPSGDASTTRAQQPSTRPPAARRTYPAHTPRTAPHNKEELSRGVLFVVKFLYKLRVPIRPLHRLLQPPPLSNSLPYPLSILARVRARSTAPAGPSRAARRRHPSAASFSSDAPATSFQKYASVFWLSGVDASVAQPRSALLRRVATYRDCVSRDNPRATE